MSLLSSSIGADLPAVAGSEAQQLSIVDSSVIDVSTKSIDSEKDEVDLPLSLLQEEVVQQPVPLSPCFAQPPSDSGSSVQHKSVTSR